MYRALKVMLPNPITIKPNHKAIQHYYETLQSYADLNQTHETGVRTAFIRLLEDTARLQSWTLVTEVGQKVEGRTIRPDLRSINLLCRAATMRPKIPETISTVRFAKRPPKATRSQISS